MLYCHLHVKGFFFSKTSVLLGSRLVTAGMDEQWFLYCELATSEPTLKSIEHFWDIFKKDFRDSHSTSESYKIIVILADVWHTIPAESLFKLVEYMSCHVAPIIKARKGPTIHLSALSNSVARHCKCIFHRTNEVAYWRLGTWLLLYL